jgi:hypothetical protein
MVANKVPVLKQNRDESSIAQVIRTLPLLGLRVLKALPVTIDGCPENLGSHLPICWLFSC